MLLIAVGFLLLFLVALACTFQVLGVAFVVEYAERKHTPSLQCSTLGMTENK